MIYYLFPLDILIILLDILVDLLSNELFMSIITGVIAGLIVGYFYEVGKAKNLSIHFTIESINVIDKIRVGIGLNINEDLLNRILLKSTSLDNIEKDMKNIIIEETKRIVGIKDTICLKELNKIYLEYNYNFAIKKSRLLYKAEKEEIESIYNEIYSMENLMLHCKTEDCIGNMLYYLSEIYSKFYELKDKHTHLVIYKMWSYKMEKKIFLFRQKKVPNEKLPYIDDFYFYNLPK